MALVPKHVVIEGHSSEQHAQLRGMRVSLGAISRGPNKPQAEVQDPERGPAIAAARNIPQHDKQPISCVNVTQKYQGNASMVIGENF